MPEVPKIVHDRLRAAGPQGVHPDADLLTAFAEQALSGSERENVLAHLAACRDCRDVVALTPPQLEVVARPKAAEEVSPLARRVGVITHPPRWLSWPSLHWAAVAAGVVVVAGVLILRNSKQQPSMVDIVNEQAAQSSPAAPESKPAPPETATVAVESPSPVQAETQKRQGEPQSLQDELRRSQLVAGRVVSVPPVTQPSGAAREYSTLADIKRRDTAETDKLALKTAPVPAGQAVDGMMAREQAQVSAGAASVATESSAVAPTAPAQKEMARNEPLLEITKAKKATAGKEEAAPAKAQAESNFAAPQELTANAYSSSKQDTLRRKAIATKDAAVGAWSLAQGVLFHAEGKTWKVALQATHPLITFGARAEDVWAGGQAGTLFHSRDNGTTWTQIQPSTKSESLKADIVAIDIRSTADVVLTTSNNESWSTSDGGLTWEKK